MPESSYYGRALNRAVWELGTRCGTHECQEMYRDRSNVFVFDAWVKPPPRGLHSVSNDPKGRKPEEAGTRVPAESGTRFGSEERTVAASGHAGAGSVSPKTEKTVSIMDSNVEIEEYNVDDKEDDQKVGKWKKVVKKGKKTDADNDAIIPETRQGFQLRVPSWR